MSLRVSESSLDDIGDRDAPPGSKEWTRHFLIQTKIARDDFEKDVSVLQTLLNKLDKYSAWKPLGYLSLEALCQNELEIEPDILAAILAAPKGLKIGVVLGKQEYGKGKPGPGRGHKTGDNITRFKHRGTDPAYSLARLDRDRPDLAAAVRAEQLTVNEAAIQAGFRRRTISISLSVELVAKALKKHFTASQLAELKKLL